MTKNVVNMIYLWLFKIISGYLKSLKKNEMKLTSNHLAGDFTHNQELIVQFLILIIIMLIELLLTYSHWIFVLIYNFIIFI